MEENVESPAQAAEPQSKGKPILLIVVAIVVVSLAIGGFLVHKRLAASKESKDEKPKDLTIIQLADDKFFISANQTTGRRKQLHYTFMVEIETKLLESTQAEVMKYQAKIKEAIRGIILEQDYAEMITNELLVLKEIKVKVLNYLEKNLSDVKIYELHIDSWDLP